MNEETNEEMPLEGFGMSSDEELEDEGDGASPQIEDDDYDEAEF